MQAGIIYSQEALKIGQFRYASQLLDQLRERLGDELKEHPFVKKEYEFIGRPFGGYISLWIQKIFSRFEDEIVHALDPVCAPSAANVVTIHDLIPFKFPSIYLRSIHDHIGHRFNRYIAKKIPFYLVQTDHVKEDLIELWDIDEDNIYKTPPGLSHEIFHPSDRIPECMDVDKNILLFVGDDNPRKNLPLILRSMKFLDDARLIWVGGSKWGKIQKRCDRIIEKSDLDVVRPGFIPDEELKDYYSSADLFVYPSKDEGTGYTPIEAMACGTTSVVSDIDVFHEVLGENVYYSAMEPERLADMIEEGLANPIPANKLTDYASRFRWEKTADATIEAYQKIAQRIR